MILQIILPEKYKTGHSNIDGHHTHLFNILYTIVSVMKNKTKTPLHKINEEVTNLFSELHKYTRNHFQYEERIMEKLKYPDIENHKELHKGFIKKILEMQKEATKNHADKFIALETMISFLKEWYLEHILIEDNKLVAHQKAAEKATEKATETTPEKSDKKAS